MKRERGENVKEVSAPVLLGLTIYVISLLSLSLFHCAFSSCVFKVFRKQRGGLFLLRILPCCLHSSRVHTADSLRSATHAEVCIHHDIPIDAEQKHAGEHAVRSIHRTLLVDRNTLRSRSLSRRLLSLDFLWGLAIYRVLGAESVRHAGVYRWQGEGCSYLSDVRGFLDLPRWLPTSWRTHESMQNLCTLRQRKLTAPKLE